MTIDHLKPGHDARLLDIGGERSFRCRLMEMGLLPGTTVRMIRRADAAGVLEVEVRGSRLTVRRADAGAIRVCEPGA